MSVERIKLIRAYGAKIILTESAKVIAGAVQKADEMYRENGGSIISGQFVNFANPKARYMSTCPEIWRNTDENLEVFVAGVGTGGTLWRARRYLKEHNSLIRIIAMEHDGSALLSGEYVGAHDVQGIAADFIPKVLDRLVYDEIVRVTDDEAFAAMKELAVAQGLLVSTSSGASAIAAAKVAAGLEFEEKTVVVIHPDTGKRYLSIMKQKSQE